MQYIRAVNQGGWLAERWPTGGVASSRIRPLTRLVGKFSKSKVSPKKKKFARRGQKGIPGSTPSVRKVSLIICNLTLRRGGGGGGGGG